MLKTLMQLKLLEVLNGAKAEREAAAAKAQEDAMADLIALDLIKLIAVYVTKSYQKGDGAKPESGKTVAVHYKGHVT